MLPWLGELHGNASSIHSFGQQAREAVEGARAQVAELLGGRPPEIVFTASGTEANNAVLKSAVLQSARSGLRGQLVVPQIEHPSVRNMVASLEQLGVEVAWVAPDGQGRVSAEQVFSAVREDTLLVCLMLANNEVGTLQPVPEVTHRCRELGVPVLCDAVQAVGKVSVNVGALGADFVTLGAHKFYGPLGAAALWVREGMELSSFLVGGGQERRRRASTENVAALVGLGEAAELAHRNLEANHGFLRELRTRFESGLGGIQDVVVHGAGVERLPNTSHVAFPGAANQDLVIRLDLAGFAVSGGSACSSGAVEPSATMKAMQISREQALSSIRVSFGTTNTRDEVDRFLGVLQREVAALRNRVGRGA